MLLFITTTHTPATDLGFQSWVKDAANRNNYQVKFLSVGEAIENLGAPTQMAIFTINN